MTPLTMRRVHRQSSRLGWRGIFAALLSMLLAGCGGPAAQNGTSVQPVIEVTPLPTQDTAATEAALVASAVPTATPLTTTYTVQPGDTLFAIAARFNTTVDRIAALNGLTDINQLQVGQQLRVPASDQADLDRTASPLDDPTAPLTGTATITPTEIFTP